ncbi:MAG: helix-turn-helix domain-containing protein, partial [Chloroflexota bacterium]
MSKRQYEQVCALSVALDILGDRWTLLVLRELLFGSRRYSDILRGVPNMGTNLLAKRLKELEAAGLIQQTKLPPPAATTVYEFTAVGQQALLPIITTLTDFGVQHLQYPPIEGHFVPASSTMGAMNKFFTANNPSISEAVQIFIPNDAFYCVIEDGKRGGVGFGLSPKPATIVLRSIPDVIMGLVVGYVDVKTAVSDQRLTIEQGELTAVESF